MQVELKNVKINNRLSEETMCFSADIWIDGVKVGTAANRGQGGCNEIHIPDRKIAKALDEFCQAQPPLPAEPPFNMELKMDTDLYITLLAAKVEELKALKRRSKTTTFFRIKSEKYKDGEWRTVKAPYSPEVKKFLVAKYGDDLGEIANESL